MIPIAIASALSQFAPVVARWLGGPRAEDAASVVVEIAKGVAGIANADDALQAIQKDPMLAFQFQQAIMLNQADLDKAYLADVQDARQRDVELAKATGHTNRRANAMAAGAVSLVILCLVVVVWKSAMDEYAKSIITLILGRALGWVEQIFSFEYGTTRANKTKDETINNLSR
jgi:uncharacterized protein (UPF0212 family)